MNNEQDINILADLLEGLEVKLDEEDEQEKEKKPDYDTEILNLLTTLSDEEAKKKVISYLNKINKKEDKDDDKLEKDISKELIEKNLSNQIIDLILLYASKANQLQELADYIENPIVNYSDLLNNNTLETLFAPIPLTDSFKNKIINMAGASENVTFGKGELALVVFLKNAKKYKSNKE
jgi:signal recognition particle GTPase